MLLPDVSVRGVELIYHPKMSCYWLERRSALGRTLSRSHIPYTVDDIIIEQHDIGIIGELRVTLASCSSHVLGYSGYHLSRW